MRRVLLRSVVRDVAQQQHQQQEQQHRGALLPRCSIWGEGGAFLPAQEVREDRVLKLAVVAGTITVVSATWQYFQDNDSSCFAPV